MTATRLPLKLTFLSGHSLVWYVSPEKLPIPSILGGLGEDTAPVAIMQNVDWNISPSFVFVSH